MDRVAVVGYFARTGTVAERFTRDRYRMTRGGAGENRPRR
jgi:hypothetical protein